MTVGGGGTRQRLAAAGWVAAGASLVGGCCGITPEHIAALTAAAPGWAREA